MAGTTAFAITIRFEMICRLCNKETNDFAPRRTECKPCKALQAKAHRKLHPEKSRAAVNSYYERAKPLAQKRKAIWHAKNKEERNLRRKENRAANVEREVLYRKRYVQDNLPKFAAWAAARRAGIRTATPSWVDKKDLEYVYDMAALFGMSVDHIYPLKGKRACGLHVPWNLQLMPLIDNISKGNKMPEELNA